MKHTRVFANLCNLHINPENFILLSTEEDGELSWGDAVADS
jgi:hypothetical protein